MSYQGPHCKGTTDLFVIGAQVEFTRVPISNGEFNLPNLSQDDTFEEVVLCERCDYASDIENFYVG